jgi:hypothetical protein
VSDWDEMSSWWFSSKPETQYENSLYRSIKELKCASELTSCKSEKKCSLSKYFTVTVFT